MIVSTLLLQAFQKLLLNKEWVPKKKEKRTQEKKKKKKEKKELQKTKWRQEKTE